MKQFILIPVGLIPDLDENFRYIQLDGEWYRIQHAEREDVLKTEIMKLVNQRDIRFTLENLESSFSAGAENKAFSDLDLPFLDFKQWLIKNFPGWVKKYRKDLIPQNETPTTND